MDQTISVNIQRLVPPDQNNPPKYTLESAPVWLLVFCGAFVVLIVAFTFVMLIYAVCNIRNKTGVTLKQRLFCRRTELEEVGNNSRTDYGYTHLNESRISVDRADLTGVSDSTIVRDEVIQMSKLTINSTSDEPQDFNAFELFEDTDDFELDTSETRSTGSGLTTFTVAKNRSEVESYKCEF